MRQDLVQPPPAAATVVHLLLSANVDYLQHVAVCLTSLLVNNPYLFFDIVVVGRGEERLDDEPHEKLRRSLARFPNQVLRLHGFTPPADRLPPVVPGGFYTLDTWTRLWVGDLFPTSVERVLYFDSDMVVVGDIAPLWHAELGGALLGAVDIPGSTAGTSRLGMRAEDGYFNAGVLLFDLLQWRDSHALETVLDYVAAHRHQLDHFLTVDQDALNACFHARRARLPYKWNAIRPFYYREPSWVALSQDELAAVRSEACIIHFNGTLKPWSYFSDHPRKGEYEKYLRMTEWRDFVPPDRTPLNMLRKGASIVLPKGVKTLLRLAAKQAARPRRATGKA